MQILTPRNYYKPFEYPFAYDIYKQHEAMHWLPGEVEFREDINDWNGKLSDAEKNLLTQLFRFFTQADVDVAAGYNKLFLPYFSHKPELAMMMDSFANREAVHIDAYSLLIETVGMPENTYQAFQGFQEMKAKHEFVEGCNTDSPEEVLKSLAVYSAFTEGMQLFSSFAILMNFERMNKMKGMSNIVRWSIRDESMHVEGMTRLFREFYKEYVDQSKPEYKEHFVNNFPLEIMDIADRMVELEDNFIDLCFEQGGIEGLTADELKLYIRYISNKRWSQLGFSGIIFDNATENPLQWLDWTVNGVEHTSFFEARVTEYSKGSMTGNLNDVQW